MTKSHVTAAVFKLRARFLDTFQVRRCWIKIDSAVNLGEKPSSELMQCVLWVIWLTKTVESICCAVRHTVTLPTAVWRTIHSPHSVRVLIATTTDAGHHRPSAARPTMPAVRSVGVVYYAVIITRLLLSACCLPLATSLGVMSFDDILGFILCYKLLFPVVPISISLDTVLSHNYRITPVVKVIFWFPSCLLITDNKGRGWPVTLSS